MQKARRALAQIAGRFLFIGISVQIVLGICWMIRAFGIFPEFGDSYLWLRAADTLVCDDYMGIGYSLNIIMGILIAIGQKCHNISCLGGRQDIGKTVNVDLLSVLQCRFHGHTHHSCRPAEEDHYNSGEKHRQRNAEDPAEYLPQKCLTDLFLFFVKT
jgi:hypothetical protein